VYICDNIAHNFFLKKYFRQKLQENQNIHFIIVQQLFISENRALYEIMWRHMVQQDSQQIKIEQGACALHDG
jgi:hypothetical protein